MDPEIEKKWIKRWQEAHIFEPSIETDRKKFLITVPWPYTNGSLHVGHGKSYTIGDIVARYKRARNYNVLFPMGFHQSGTPIFAYAERIASGDKRAIDQYRSYIEQYENAHSVDKVLAEMRNPDRIADYFSNATLEDFRALGYSIDWTRKFTSAEATFQNFVQWQFRRLKSKGYIKQGEYPILYSLKDENAVGEDDIADGDINKVSIEEFTAIKFRSHEYSLLAASLRPETIFGVTNLWINPNAEYVLVEFSGEKIVMSEMGSEKFIRQVEGATVLRKISKEEILSRSYTVPLTGKSVGVIPSQFVDPDNGTGIVYSVPGHSIYDFIALRNSGSDIAPIRIIELDRRSRNMTVESIAERYNIKDVTERKKLDEATKELYREEFYFGKMLDNCGEFSGKSVSEARGEIKNLLSRKGNALVFYETSRKALTRSGFPVIVAVLNGQWFIDYSVREWKDATHRLVDRMTFVPDIQRKAMHDIIEWLRERPCARRRGLGTPLPFDPKWVIESLSDSTIYPAVYTNILELRKIREKLGTIPDSVFDYIFLHEGVPGNYDAETLALIDKARNEVDYWYGCDMRITAIPHISNHLVFYLMNHVAIFPEPMYPGGVGILGLVISEGKKIGKSKGNIVNLLSVTRRYSADIYRLYVAVVADAYSQLDWNENDLDNLIKRYRSLTDILDRYVISTAEPGLPEKWFISKFYSRLRDFISQMDAYSIRPAFVSIFYEVLNDLRRVERRGGDINVALSHIMRDWLVALSAVIPFTAEEYWHRYVKDTFVSLETLPTDLESKISETILKSEEYLDRVVEDIRNILQVTGQKAAKITIRVSTREERDFIEKFERGDIASIDERLKPLIPKYRKAKRFIRLFEFDELSVLRENSDYISNLFSCEVEVLPAKFASADKVAWPGKPLILIS